MAHEARTFLGNHSASYLDMFIKQADSGWEHKRTGYLRPWSESDGFRDIRRIPFIIKPGQEILVYQQMKFELRLYPQQHITVYFGFTEKMSGDTYDSESKNLENLRFGFLFGICLVAAIFCFLFFLATREWVYFHASMMDLSIALFNFLSPFRDILFREHLGIRDFGYPVVIAFFIYFTSSTFRIALDTKLLFPRLNKFLLILGILPFLDLIAVFVFKLSQTTVT